MRIVGAVMAVKDEIDSLSDIAIRLLALALWLEETIDEYEVDEYHFHDKKYYIQIKELK